MRPIRQICLIFFVAAFFAGCAGRGSVGSLTTKIDGMQKKVDELKVRIDKIESGKK